MDVKELAEILRVEVENEVGLPWLEGYTDFGSFRPDGSPEVATHVVQFGLWLLVTIQVKHSGTTMDQSTDRASGDPYSVEVTYSWIGIAETAPEKVSTKAELDEWSVLNTRYVCEYTDVGSWGVHQGSFVADYKEDGTISVAEASGAFQDVSPGSTAEVKTVKLKSP